MLIFLSLIDTEEDKRKFELIYYRYRNLMFYIANEILNDSSEAEDCVQNAFIKIIENLEKIDDEYSKKTKAFVSIITENKAIDLYRMKKKIEYQEFDEELIIDNDSVQCLDNSFDINNAINKLPYIYREVLYLKYYNDYRASEIAEILNMSEDNVYKVIQRAKARLKELLEE